MVTSADLVSKTMVCENQSLNLFNIYNTQLNGYERLLLCIVGYFWHRSVHTTGFRHSHILFQRPKLHVTEGFQTSSDWMCTMQQTVKKNISHFIFAFK